MGEKLDFGGYIGENLPKKQTNGGKNVVFLG